MMKIPTKDYESICEYIQSADSPVGIDAKKTHIYIIHTLHDIQKRLAVLEQQSAGKKPPIRKTDRSKRGTAKK